MVTFYSEDDSDDPLNDDFVIESEQNTEPFVPLLCESDNFAIENDLDKPTINAISDFFENHEVQLYLR